MKTIRFFLISCLFLLNNNSCEPIPDCKECDSSGLTIDSRCCSSTGPIQIYKTRRDYSCNVSVKLSADKKTILAYPGPKDAANQYPIKLARGYLLKRMVGNAFLSISIDEYQKLPTTLSHEEMLKMVVDDEPFTEFYECCKLCLHDADMINKLILENKLCNCDTVGWWIFN